MDDFALLWALSGAFVLVFALLRIGIGNRKQAKGFGNGEGRLPPSPPAWPVIGHLHLMAKSIPHTVLADLAKTYGPIVYLNMGSMPTVVVSSPEMARLFLQVHDKNFSDRPAIEFQRQTAHNKGIVFVNSNEEWKETRWICSTVVFQPKIWASSEHIRMEELRAMLIRASTGTPVNLAKECEEFVSSTMSRLLFTDPKHTKHIKDLSSMASVIVTTPVIGDFIPFLSCLDYKTKRKMKCLGSQVDSMFGGLIDLRRRAYKSQMQTNDGMPPHRDFLDALLSAVEDQNFPHFNNDESIVHICADLLGASVDTTSTTMEWCMSELLANPDEMKKLQEEIDKVMMMVPSGQRMVTAADIQNMGYLKAVIKETLRLHPPAPLLIPHASSSLSTLKVGEYRIPPKTRVMVNVWAIGRDPSIWEDPLRFSPGRFMKGEKMQDLDLVGHHFELMPFGSGRRRCPGIAVALGLLELGISNLVHAYDWVLPSGVKLDMLERPGLTIPRLNPLIALCTPRNQIEHLIASH